MSNANTKQHPGKMNFEKMLFENCSHSSCENSKTYCILENKQKKKYVRIHEIIRLITMKKKMKKKKNHLLRRKKTLI